MLGCYETMLCLSLQIAINVICFLSVSDDGVIDHFEKTLFDD
jgi:hypothetical protein